MQATGEGVSVLHVDDEPDFADLTATFVEREDDRFSVETATSADEGMDRLADDDFDCIVSDYDMPGQNGVEFLETVREDHPDLPFILFTGKGSEEVASDAISAGATDYLRKGSGTDRYELLANRIRNAVEQYRHKRRRATLERIRTTVNDVNQALIRASSREETETQICEILAEADPYRLAVFAEVDSEQRIVPRASAGTGEAFLDEFEMSVAEGTPGRRAPDGRAFHDREIAVAQNIQSDPAYEPWRDLALEHDFQALAVVPLQYESDRYGLLAVFADRPHAFDETEQEVLEELGDDIAHAMHAEEIHYDLQRSERRFEAVFEDPQMLVGVLDADGTLLQANQTAMDFIDADSDDVIGESFWETPWWTDGIRDDIRRKVDRAKTGEYVEYEADLPRPTGDRYSVNGTIRPVTDSEGAVVSLIVSARDITEQKTYEQRIETLHTTVQDVMQAQTTEEVAEVVVSAIDDVLDKPTNAVYLYDESDQCLFPVAWTEHAEELIGELPTFQPGDGLAWEVFETGETQVYEDVSTEPGSLNPETNVRSEILIPLGSHGVLIVGSGVPDAFDEADVSLVQTLVAHATTALGRVERKGELTRRQSLFEAILEASIDGILVVDENREYVTWNQQFVDMWGIPEELVGDESEEMALSLALDQLERPDEFIDKVEYLYEHPGEESRDRIQLTDGRVFDRYSAPVESDDGTYFGRVWFFRDITEQEQHKQELTRQNERLEEFAGIVSHDLRNPLNVAEGRLELAQEESDSDHLDDAVNAVERSLSLIEDLLTLAREGDRADAIEPVDLAEMVDRCWQNVETGDATLAIETDRTIQADSSRMKQLLANLLRNAVEHGGRGMTVTIGDLDGGFYVADDGPGISPDEREQVFEAGYSTTEGGTGFGLSIVQEVADAHGWEISVTQSRAGGARFEVTGVESDQ